MKNKSEEINEIYLKKTDFRVLSYECRVLYES